MREEIKRQNSAKDELTNRIIEMEWEMFDKVQNAGGRASCQDDEWTFYVMRYSQHNAFSTDTLKSYEQDLLQAVSEGRNLLTEKYAYMMEFTDSDYFDENLRDRLPRISPEKADLIDRITNLMLRGEQEFKKAYPLLSGRGRPLFGTGEGDVSFHIYAMGELKTYSLRTLRLYLQDMQGEPNPAFSIHRTTAEFYGYRDLEDAEQKIRGQQL